jgi:hypothetical protein
MRKKFSLTDNLLFSVEQKTFLINQIIIISIKIRKQQKLTTNKTFFHKGSFEKEEKRRVDNPGIKLIGSSIGG